MIYRRPATVELPPELDKKAKEVHARMAVYIDNFIYRPKEERDDSRIYEYIYHISYMLACKYKMFENAKDYEEFSLYSASKVYGRLINERQFSTDPNTKKLEKITSVLNYVKNSLYGMKVSYQNESFKQVTHPDYACENQKLLDNMRANVQADYQQGLVDDIIATIQKVPSVALSVINKTHYRTDKIMHRRLYISCLLSFLNSMVLPNKYKNKLEKKKESINNDELAIKWLKQETDNSVILWKLDPIYTDYVDILVKRIKEKLADNIIETRNSFTLPEDTLNSIIRSPLSDYYNTNKGDVY